MPASDTTSEAARVQREVLASKSGAERASMVFEMSELVYRLTIDGIRRRHPDLDEAEVMLALIERMHGRELARAVAESDVVIGGD